MFVWCCNEKEREWQLVFPTCDNSYLGALALKENSCAPLLQDILFSVSLFFFYLPMNYMLLLLLLLVFSSVLSGHVYNGSKGENYVRPWGLIYTVLSIPMTVLAPRMALKQTKYRTIKQQQQQQKVTSSTTKNNTKKTSK